MYRSLYLVHHGIKGQEWGVRRYQTDDGSLTSAGKSRYVDDPGNRFAWGDHDDGGSRNDRGSKSHRKMSPKKKRSLAKKVAIGVGAVALTAAAAYGINKGTKFLAGKAMEEQMKKSIRAKELLWDAENKAPSVKNPKHLIGSKAKKARMTWDHYNERRAAFQRENTAAGLAELKRRKQGMKFRDAARYLTDPLSNYGLGRANGRYISDKVMRRKYVL